MTGGVPKPEDIVFDDIKENFKLRMSYSESEAYEGQRANVVVKAGSSSSPPIAYLYLFRTNI